MGVCARRTARFVAGAAVLYGLGMGIMAPPSLSAAASPHPPSHGDSLRSSNGPSWTAPGTTPTDGGSVAGVQGGTERPAPSVAPREPSATAPEKSVRQSPGQDRQLMRTFDRAQEFLSAGRVEEAVEQFALVAKLAEEPLRSQAMLKFGYAASILGSPKSRGALTAALQTQVPDPEGREIKTFARKILESSEPSELLIAQPKQSSKFFPVRPQSATPSAGLWDQIKEIEIYRGKGRVSMAIHRYRELLDAYPDHPVLLNNLALILADGVDPQEAESLIRRAFLAPGAEKYVEYLYDTLGLAKLRQGLAAESIDHFRHALSMRETVARNLHMALALETIGQPDAAEQYRSRASALDTTGELSAAP